MSELEGLRCACGQPAHLHVTTIENDEKFDRHFCWDHPPAGMERHAAESKAATKAIEEMVAFWEPRLASGRCSIRPALQAAWIAGRQWSESQARGEA